MRSSARVLLFAATFMVAISTATCLIAAPIPWARIDVTRHSGQNEGVMLVSAELASTASLPAEAELAVPAGYQLQWVGEILGGPPAQDPELTYVKSTAKGIDLYRVTLTKSRIAQIEVVVPETQTFDGTSYTSAVVWTAPQDVPEVQLNIRIPEAAKLATQAVGASVFPGDTGYSFYTKTFTTVKAGDRLELAAVYTLAAGGSTTPVSQAAGTSPAIPVILVLGALAAAAGLVYAVSRKLKARSSEEEDADSSEREDGNAGSVGEADDGDDDEPADDEESGESESEPASSSSKMRKLVTGAIIAVLVAAAVFVGGRSTRPQSSGDTISQTFSAGEPCETASVPIKGTNNPQQTADRLFAALGKLTGLNTATYDLKTGTIAVGYCESQTSAGAVREVLESTGLVAAGASSVSTTSP